MPLGLLGTLQRAQACHSGVHLTLHQRELLYYVGGVRPRSRVAGPARDQKLDQARVQVQLRRERRARIVQHRGRRHLHREIT